MPRRKLKIIPGRTPPNCFAFYTDKGGNPQCAALSDVYCLKEYTPCTFRKTPQAAMAAQRSAAIRLAQCGRGSPSNEARTGPEEPVRPGTRSLTI